MSNITAEAARCKIICHTRYLNCRPQMAAESASDSCVFPQEYDRRRTIPRAATRSIVDGLAEPMSEVSAMSVDSSRPREAAPSVMFGVVFSAFLVNGLAMPVLLLHVHQGLGLGAFVVGLVAGAQFAASLLSRFWAGHFADSRGAKRATVTGLLVAAVSRKRSP